MNAQDTRTTSPAWFNLDAVIEPAKVEELHRLAAEVERMMADFEGRLGEACYRALHEGEQMASGLDLGDEGFELFRRYSGSGRLHDALYAFADSVGAANMERPGTEPVWWVKVRAELRLNEWGVPTDAQQ